MRQLSLAIVGAIHPNRKGPSRRFKTEICRPGEPVELRPEPKNPFDHCAIAVYSSRGVQIGYVRAERAQFIGTAIQRDGVKAIFQRSEPWGSTIRVSLDGSEPILPADDMEQRASDWPPPNFEDEDWRSDPEYQDD